MTRIHGDGLKILAEPRKRLRIAKGKSIGPDVCSPALCFATRGRAESIRLCACAQWDAEDRRLVCEDGAPLHHAVSFASLRNYYVLDYRTGEALLMMGQRTARCMADVRLHAVSIRDAANPGGVSPVYAQNMDVIVKAEERTPYKDLSFPRQCVTRISSSYSCVCEHFSYIKYHPSTVAYDTYLLEHCALHNVASNNMIADPACRARHSRREDASPPPPRKTVRLRPLNLQPLVQSSDRHLSVQLERLEDLPEAFTAYEARRLRLQRDGAELMATAFDVTLFKSSQGLGFLLPEREPVWAPTIESAALAVGYPELGEVIKHLELDYE